MTYRNGELIADVGVDPIASIYGLGYRFEWSEEALSN